MSPLNKIWLNISIFMNLSNLRSLLCTESTSFSVVFISLSLIIYPATVLLVPKLNGLIFGLFSLTGLVYLFIHRDQSTRVNRDEAWLYFSVSIFFLTSLLIVVNAGFVYKVLGKYLHLLLFIPVYIYLRHTGVKLFFVWYGLVTGSIVAAGVAIYDVWITDSPRYWGNGEIRAMGITHPIIFGDLALVMGCMSMAGLGWFKQRANWLFILPLIALFCGLLASVFSVSRGGWLAVPFLVVLFFWNIKSLFSFQQKAILAVVVALFLGLIYLLPQTGVSKQVDRTFTSLQQYSDSEITSNNRATSVGTRLEMWQASWKIFQDNPVLGIGWGHYKEQAQLQVDQGLRNQIAASFGHPHSQYFSALVGGGSLGFVILMMLFFIPVRLFVKYINHGETVDIKRLALAGLVLIVAYMAFCISEPMLERSRSVNFFSFYLAVFMAAIYGQKKS